ncbi:MAG: hypothetical protein NUV50_03380, partial [Rhodospirillales bacterium]|nr:hypothetical protein [Rhodospirillales bacterium]
TIGGVPTGATLSAGTDNGDGTWTLTPDQLTGLTITPPANFNGSFDLTVTSTSTDTLGNVTDSASTSSTLTVGVSAVDDAPSLVLGSASGAEDSAIPLNISATSTGGVDVASVTITGVPAGAVLSAGTFDAATGTWTLAPSDLAGLTITPPADYAGAFDLNVTATAADGSVSTGTATVDVTPVADMPTVAAADVAGAEDTAIALDISSALTDTDGSETLSIQISGIPEGAILVSGTDTITLVGDVANLTPDQLANLTITPPQNFSGSFDLMVTSTSTDGTDTAVNNTTFTVDVAAVGDAANVGVTDAAGLEDNAIALEITAEPTGGVAVDSIVIGGVPAGATLSAGTFNAGTGEWTLSPQELTGLTVTPPVNFSGAFDLNITAISADGATTQASTTVAVEAVADAPTLTVSAGTPTETVDGGTPVTPSDYSNIQFGASGNDDDDEGGQNNGFGNGDQDAPGNSGDNNNAENDKDDDNNKSGGDDDKDDGKDDGKSGGKDDDDKDDGKSGGKDDDEKDDGSSKDDVLIGSKKDDEIDGGKGDDLISGKAGDDQLSGGDGDDVIFGGAGDDEIDGEDGNDVLFGGSGDDTISGGDGDDFLIGGSGNDTLKGGDGEDVIVAGSGNNAVDGGSGDDTMVFSGARDEYLITEVSSDKGGSQYIVEHLGGGDDGISLVESIETFQFSDGQYSLDDMLASNPTEGGDVTLTYDITIETGLTDTDGSETLSDVTIAGVPSGATLSAGTYDAASDSWTLGADDLSGLTMQVTQEVSADFSLSVSVTSTEPNGDAATTTSSIDIALPDGFVDNTGDTGGTNVQGDTSTDALDPLAVMFEDSNTLTFEGEQYDISELTAGDSVADYGGAAPLGSSSNAGAGNAPAEQPASGEGYSSSDNGNGTDVVDS